MEWFYYSVGEVKNLLLSAYKGCLDETADDKTKPEEVYQEMRMDYYLTKTQKVLGRIGEAG